MLNAYWTVHSKENAGKLSKPECSGNKAAKQNVSKLRKNLNGIVTKEIKVRKENRFGRQ